MKNFVHKGETLTVTAPYGVTSGGGLQVGNMFGVAVNTQITGDNMEMMVVGVFDLAKDTSTFSDGDYVYWDNVNLVCTSNNPGNDPANLQIGTADMLNADGTAPLGGLSGDATVRVRLTAAFPGGTGKWAYATLTAAQIIAMEATPVSIIPAPGAGKAIIVEEILFEMTTTATQFTGGGALTFEYHGTATAVHAGTIPASVVTTTAGTTQTLLGPAVASNGTVVPSNTGVDITNASAPFAAGTGTAKVFVKFSVINL